MNSGWDALPVFSKNTGFCSDRSQPSASLVARGKIHAGFFRVVSLYIAEIFSGCHCQVLAPVFFLKRRVWQQLQRWRSMKTTKQAARLVFSYLWLFMIIYHNYGFKYPRCNKEHPFVFWGENLFISRLNLYTNHMLNFTDYIPTFPNPPTEIYFKLHSAQSKTKN